MLGKGSWWGWGEPGVQRGGGPGQEKRSLSHSVGKRLRQMGRQIYNEEELVLALGP